jgi:tellurium resistance protein TerD
LPSKPHWATLKRRNSTQKPAKEEFMAVSLSKGGNVSLSKESPGLKDILVGLGWDARATDGGDFDLDASAFLLKEDGKVRSDSDFIFYNNTRSSDGSVEHTGDNRTGAGEGDDEAIKIALDKVPQDVQKISVTVTIHEAEARRQNFGMVSNAFIRIVNQADNQEITRFDLSEDMSTETAMVFGEVYRHGGEWKFKAVGQGYAGGLGPLARNFGVNV